MFNAIFGYFSDVLVIVARHVIVEVQWSISTEYDRSYPVEIYFLSRRLHVILELPKYSACICK